MQRVKHCTGCSSDKSILEFNKNIRTADGFQNYCKKCKAIATRNWKNGIRSGQLDAMKKKQNNKCEICEQKNENLVIDHCHITGKIRSLLCRKCNGMLGMAQESVLILEKAIKYIKNWSGE